MIYFLILLEVALLYIMYVTISNSNVYHWSHLMKIILSVPDEGYSERTWWRLFWASPDEGYSERHLMKVILSVTWWRLFWASPDEGYSRNASGALNLISTFISILSLGIVFTKIKLPTIYDFQSLFLKYSSISQQWCIYINKQFLTFIIHHSNVVLSPK
jgi:hypothetical protein